MFANGRVCITERAQRISFRYLDGKIPLSNTHKPTRYWQQHPQDNFIITHLRCDVCSEQSTATNTRELRDLMVEGIYMKTTEKLLESEQCNTNDCFASGFGSCPSHYSSNNANTLISKHSSVAKETLAKTLT